MLRQYDSPSPLLIGYDPFVDLPNDHLARLVELVVEESVVVRDEVHPGQPKFDPRLCLKVLIYGYATGLRSSRALEKQCRESLPYLFLSRGDTPSYKTLCSFRTQSAEMLEDVWMGLFVVAKNLGLNRLGRIVVDSTKLRANTGSEMILAREEYAQIKQELQNIKAEAEARDKLEDAEGYDGETRTGKDAGKLQMRDILRNVRRELSRHAKSTTCDRRTPEKKDEAPKCITSRMKKRIKDAIDAISEAEADGRDHLCLTDTDARMMHGGVDKKIHECHSLEVAIDRDCGLLVGDGVTQIGNDNERLVHLVESAKMNEPESVKAVDGDSGYFSGTGLLSLIECGIDTCIPDSITACELHRGMRIGTLVKKRSVALEYDAANDVYHCPEGNELTKRASRGRDDCREDRYRSVRGCKGCVRYGECIVRADGKPAKATHKWIGVRQCQAVLAASIKRFDESEHRERYNMRASFVETVHAFIRGVLGYDRWLLRGSDKVKHEGKLMTTAYQFRKLHLSWVGHGAR
jgi:transposase